MEAVRVADFLVGRVLCCVSHDLALERGEGCNYGLVGRDSEDEMEGLIDWSPWRIGQEDRDFVDWVIGF